MYLEITQCKGILCQGFNEHIRECIVVFRAWLISEHNNGKTISQSQRSILQKLFQLHLMTNEFSKWLNEGVMT